MTSWLSFLLATALAVFGLAATPRLAFPQQNEATPVDREQIEAALRLTQAAAKEYSIALVGEGRPLELKAEPVLRWSNPAAGEIHGNVFLWTWRGRPMAVASLYKWFTPHTHMAHEFQSLAETKLTASFHGREVWKTSEPGLKFVPLKDAPQPGANASGRLLQLKQLAREFSATKHERNDSQSELRLLTQPIYRYESAADKIVDGALFVFVQGTDPELFLLMEARPGNGETSWHYAATRMNGVGLQLRHRNQEVWAVEAMPWKTIYDHRQIYTSFSFTEIPAFLVGTLEKPAR